MAILKRTDGTVIADDDGKTLRELIEENKGLPHEGDVFVAPSWGPTCMDSTCEASTSRARISRTRT